MENQDYSIKNIKLEWDRPNGNNFVIYNQELCFFNIKT